MGRGRERLVRAVHGVARVPGRQHVRRAVVGVDAAVVAPHAIRAAGVGHVRERRDDARDLDALAVDRRDARRALAQQIVLRVSVVPPRDVEPALHGAARAEGLLALRVRAARPVRAVIELARRARRLKPHDAAQGTSHQAAALLLAVARPLHGEPHRRHDASFWVSHSC